MSYEKDLDTRAGKMARTNEANQYCDATTTMGKTEIYFHSGVIILDGLKMTFKDDKITLDKTVLTERDVNNIMQEISHFTDWKRTSEAHAKAMIKREVDAARKFVEANDK